MVCNKTIIVYQSLNRSDRLQIILIQTEAD